jgi:hypothetical protein
VWDRFWIGGDVAYLPYARFDGLDTHLLREPVAFFPQDGTGRGVQAEIRLSYLVTEKLTVGVGGRYWAMWTTSASQSCNGGCGETGVFESSPPGPFTTNTERYGVFVDMAYRFFP